jgi:hypothetical protein
MFKYFKNIVNRVTVKGDHNSVTINNNNITQSTSDEIHRLLAEGRRSEASALFNRTMKNIESAHPAHPHWRYEFLKEANGNITITHKPNYPEAVSNYPLVGKVKFKPDERFKQFKSLSEVYRQAYYKQETITLELESIKAWIGEHLIESHDASRGAMITATIRPEPLPEPIPMKFYLMDNSISFDYLLVGISEVDGSFVVLDNKSQIDALINIRLKVNFSDSSANFNIEINDKFVGDVETNLMYYKFLWEAHVKKRNIALKVLSTNKNLFEAKGLRMNRFYEKETLELIRNLEMLDKLEKFYEVKFVLSGEDLTDEESDTIDTLWSVMNDKTIPVNYTDVELELTKESILPILEGGFIFTTGISLIFEDQDKTFGVLGANITVAREVIQLDNAIIKDKDRFLRKLDLLEDHGSIKVKFEAKSSNKSNGIIKYIYKI